MISPALAQDQPNPNQPAQQPSTDSSETPKSNVLKIVEAERLELRNEGDEELVILSGNPVKMLRGGERIEAPKVIYNRTAKRLMLSGGVRYFDKKGQLIEAAELELNTANESFEAIEVKIDSGDVFLSGPICQRAAGTILLQEGYVTPCQRCQQEVNDYAFRASEVVLYPGDRIIARGVWVLLKEQKTLYLPVMLLYLNSRKPKLEVAQDDTDGLVVNAELPYVNDFGIGFTLLRYYERRGWAIGLDQYGIGPAKEHYQVMYIPPPVGADKLPASDPRKDGIWKYNLSYLLEDPEYRLEGTVRRDDDPRTDPQFEGGGQPDATTFKLEFQTKPTDLNPEPTYRLTLDGYLDHNFDLLPNESYTPQRLPEAEIKFDRGIQGEFSLTGRAMAGFYHALSNQLNRSARLLGTYINAGRLQLEHNSSYRPTPPWPGFSLNLSNHFVGNYYTTQNPDGEYERLINWSTQISIGQSFGPLSLSAAYNRNIIEGETPFQFDFQRPSNTSHLEFKLTYAPDPIFNFEALAYRDYSSNLSSNSAPLARFSITSRPADWLSASASLSRDLEAGHWGILSSRLDVTPTPFSLNLTYERSVEVGIDRQWTGSVSYSPIPFAFRASTAYRWTNIDEFNALLGFCTTANQSNCILPIYRFDPLQLSASYNPEGNSNSISHTRDLNNGQAVSTVLNVALLDGDTSFSLRQTLTHLYFPWPDPLTTAFTPVAPSLSGNINFTAGLHTFILSNTVYFNTPELVTDFEGNADLGLGYSYSAGQYSANLTGRWNFVRNYWINPRLTLSAQVSDPSYVLQQVSAEIHLGEWNLPDTPDDESKAYLRSLNFLGEIELVPAPLRTTDPPGVAVQGSLSLNRLTDGSGRFSVGLTNFGPTFSFLGEEQTRVYLRMLWNTQNQPFYFPNLENTLLKPKFVVIFDRCCWALRVEADSYAQSFKISFVLGGEANDFLFDKNGLTLPGGTQFP